MMRKLFFDLRWLFPIFPLFLIAITLEYTWAARNAWIMSYHDEASFGVTIMPTTSKPEEAERAVKDFMREHPNGEIVSLKDRPLSYFEGFDGLARTLLPFMVVFLCSGGILCEKTSGTASFLLSLPVSRSSWLWSRALALLLLTYATVALAALAAFFIAAGMGIHQSVTWLVVDPLLLTLVGAPWIGISMLLQSLLAGRFDNTAETALAAVFGLALAFASTFLLGFVSPVSAEPPSWAWYIQYLSFTKYGASAMWTMVLNVIGGIALLLTVWRFKQMDF